MANINWVDIVIVLLLIGSIGRGLRIGFLRQIFSIIGFFIGLLAGSWLWPHLLGFIHDTSNHAITVAALILISAFSLATAGDFWGERLRLKLSHGGLRKFEAGLGIILNATSVLAAVWLIGGIMVRLPSAEVSNSVSNSAIIQALDEHLPPTASIFARVNKLIGPNGFPRVFVQNEQRPKSVSLPSAPEVQAAANKALASTVKVSGFGCGGIVSGSGFVVGPGLVATNAHVIGGVRRPTVKDSHGNYAAVPVLFDPNLDFAVLRVSGLSDPVLVMAKKDATSNTTIAVLGYPGGGTESVSAGVILDTIIAKGRDIYNQGETTRNIYEITAEVEAGNSGGPVVLSDGTVAGVVFAKSVEADGYGYALTASSVKDEINQAAGSNQRVSTGPCAAD